METVITTLYIFLLAIILSNLEIQTEGKNGWAKNLPTWRPPTSRWYAKCYSWLMAGCPLTGYHLAMFSFVILMFHFPYFFGVPFEINHWLKTISLILIFFVLWDFLWFIFNPNFTLKRFNKTYVHWHKHWFFNIPVDYYVSLTLSGLFLLLPTLNNPQIFIWWVTNLALFTAELLVVIILASLVIKPSSSYPKDDFKL